MDFYLCLAPKIYPMKFFFIPLAFLFITFSSCKKEREPFERIELSNVRYSVNCLNCEQHGTNGNVANYTSIKTTFDYTTSKKVGIYTDSYLLVKWKFDYGPGGDYIIDYNDLTTSGFTISFNSAWYWASSTNVHIDLVLYSGQGSKSNVASIDIPKPAGANRLSYNTISTDNIPYGFIIVK